MTLHACLSSSHTPAHNTRKKKIPATTAPLMSPIGEAYA